MQERKREREKKKRRTKRQARKRGQKPRRRMLRKLRTTKKRSTRMRKRRKEKEFTCETFPLPACLTAAVRTKRRWAEFDASMLRGGLESRTPSPTGP